MISQNPPEKVEFKSTWSTKMYKEEIASMWNITEKIKSSWKCNSSLDSNEKSAESYNFTCNFQDGMEIMFNSTISRCPFRNLWGFWTLRCARSEVERTQTSRSIRAADFSSSSGWRLICDWSQVGRSCFFNLILWRTRSPGPPPVRDVNLCYLTSDPSMGSILSAWGAVEMEKTVDVCCFDLQTASICTAFTRPHSDLWSFLKSRVTKALHASTRSSP